MVVRERERQRQGADSRRVYPLDAVVVGEATGRVPQLVAGRVEVERRELVAGVLLQLVLRGPIQAEVPSAW